MYKACFVSLCFSIVYGVYWIVGLQDPFVSRYYFQLELDAAGKLLALAYIATEFIIKLTFLFYFMYQRNQRKMLIDEILYDFMRTYKSQILIHGIINLLLMALVVALVIKESISTQDDYIKVHMVFLCIVTQIQMYIVCRNQGFFKLIQYQLIYFALLLPQIAFCVFMDFYYSDAQTIYKHSMAGNVIIILEVLYLNLINFKGKRWFCIIFKLIQCFYLYRYFSRLTLTFQNLSPPDRILSYDFAVTLLRFFIIIFIIVKIVYDVSVYSLKKIKKYLRRKMEQEKKSIILKWLQHRQINIRETTNQQLFIQQCSICLSLPVEKVSQLECRHIFHTQCIAEWLKQHLVCPLCKARILIYRNS